MNTAPHRASMAEAHAVCLSGHSRSFGEIGHNVREGVLSMHGSPAIAFFGIRPPEDSWSLIQAMLPLTKVVVQRQCWTAEQLNTTRSWLHCDMRARRHDCRASFLQQLCDMQSCESMISDHETGRGGKPFRTVMRLRPDIFWEARVSVPRELDEHAVYVPASDRYGQMVTPLLP